MGSGFWGLGFGVWSLGTGVRGLGVGVCDLGLNLRSTSLRKVVNVRDSRSCGEFGISGLARGWVLGFSVSGLGLSLSGFGFVR